MSLSKCISIQLSIKELVYDIMNETYLQGKAIYDGTNDKSVDALYATMDDENKDKILRSIERAFQKIKAECHEYINERSKKTDDILELVPFGVLFMFLDMPLNFDVSQINSIAEHSHAFIVDTAIADWYEINSKEDAVRYATRAATNLLEIRRALSARKRPIHP